MIIYLLIFLYRYVNLVVNDVLVDKFDIHFVVNGSVDFFFITDSFFIDNSFVDDDDFDVIFLAGSMCTYHLFYIHFVVNGGVEFF